jgi:hypothetical protein
VTAALRRLTVILAAGLMTAVLAGCTGSATPQPTASSTGSAPATVSPTDSHAYGLRYGDAPALLVQCGLSSGTIKPQTSTVIGGKSLSDWQQWAAEHDALPPQVCGTSVSASALQAKIDPGQPNPWAG